MRKMRAAQSIPAGGRAQWVVIRGNTKKKLTPRRGERRGTRRLWDVVEWEDAAASRRSVLRARRVWLRLVMRRPKTYRSSRTRKQTGRMGNEDDRAVGVWVVGLRCCGDRRWKIGLRLHAEFDRRAADVARLI